MFKKNAKAVIVPGGTHIIGGSNYTTPDECRRVLSESDMNEDFENFEVNALEEAGPR